MFIRISPGSMCAWRSASPIPTSALFVYEDIPYIKLKMHVRGCVNYKIGKPHKTAVFVWCNQVVSKFAVFLMVYMIHIVSSTSEIPA